ncbi:hypothetical protein Tco_1052960 [Tanacetum coccineum]
MGNDSLCSWSFISAVPGQMTYLVVNPALDRARSYVMQGAFLTQGMVSNIPTVFSWGGSISPEGFLPSIMLLAVIIVAVVVLVVVGVIIGVVVDVSGVPSIIKLSFVITGVSLGPVLVFSVFAMFAACASRAVATLLATSCLMISYPEASQSNLVVLSHLLPLKFRNLSMSLLEFGF